MLGAWASANKRGAGVPETLAHAARALQDGSMGKTKRQFSELSVPRRTGVVILGIGQLAFAFLAYWDLAHRDEDEVKGPRAAWIPVILINWVGPAAYFLFGQKR